MVREQINVGAWSGWFAWRPVRLFGTPHFAWLRTISRRPVRDERRGVRMEYSDWPSENPPGYGRRLH